MPPDAADSRQSRAMVALIIPTLDEEDSIGPLLAEVPRDHVDRVIVADSGSRDATAAVAAHGGADVLPVGRGYGRACLAAAEAARDAQILVFMDGDGADDPALIPLMIGPIENGSEDFVIGSRTRGMAAAGSMGWHQHLAGHALGLGMRILYGVRYTDMCAFRAIRRDTLLALGMREMTYGWNLEMQMRAARARLRILEIPVDNRVRIGGESKVAGSLRGTIKATTRIVATFFRIALGRGPAPAQKA
jgi:glycosyltransferase involved in cell wall biosynthesis